MREKVRRGKPSPAMVVAIIALVFSVAGTGVAGVATISALSKGEKRQTRKIADSEINKLAPGLSVKSAETASSAQSATSAQSAESALSAALGGIGRQDPDPPPAGSDRNCDAPRATFAPCAIATLSLPAPARVLVIGRGRTAGGGDGFCQIGTSFSGPVADSMTRATGDGDNLAVIGVTTVFPAGTHSFGIDCSEDIGGLFSLLDAQVAAVALSAN